MSTQETHKTILGVKMLRESLLVWADVVYLTDLVKNMTIGNLLPLKKLRHVPVQTKGILMKKSETWLLVFLSVVLFFCVHSTFVKKHFMLKAPIENASMYICERTLYLNFILDFLMAWQSGDTNAFYQIMIVKNDSSCFWDTIAFLVKQGRGGEVTQMLNREIDHWIIMEAGHSRAYDWPDREKDRDGWALLTKIYENRLQHPHSTGNNEGDASIKRILKKTQSN
jgi:hypothetical protein